MHDVSRELLRHGAPSEVGDVAEFGPGARRLTDAEVTERLGPTLTAIIEADVQWDPKDIPPVLHSCTRMASRGKAKLAVQPDFRSPWRTQICPCGATRQLRNGRPHTPWDDRNIARRNPEHWTRSDAAANREKRLDREQRRRERWARVTHPVASRHHEPPDVGPIVHDLGPEPAPLPDRRHRLETRR